MLRSEDYTVWSCSSIFDDAGKAHVPFSRRPKQGGHWLRDGEMAHPTADPPEGPCKIVGNVLQGCGEGHWDADCVHNPPVHRVGKHSVLLDIGVA